MYTTDYTRSEYGVPGEPMSNIHATFNKLNVNGVFTVQHSTFNIHL